MYTVTLEREDNSGHVEPFDTLQEAQDYVTLCELTGGLNEYVLVYISERKLFPTGMECYETVWTHSRSRDC